MRQIPIWKGNHHHREFTGLYAIVDDEDYERVKQWHWTLAEGYPLGHVKKNGKWVKVHLHRFVMKAKRGILIDHKDRMPLNCQKDNLRECTRAENGWNREKPKSTKSKSRFKGVQWKPTNNNDKTKGKWMARIIVNNRNYHIGYFKTQEQAGLAYDLWALQLHKQFAVTNYQVVLSGP